MLIAIGSGKGGPGKTTTALAESTILYREGYAPILVDADPGYSATTSAGLVIDGDPLVDLLQGRRTLEQAIVQSSEGYDIVPGSEMLADPGLGEVSQLAERFREISRDRIVIVDTAQGTTLPVTRAVLSAAELIIIPVQPEPKVIERSYNGVIAMLDLYGNAEADLLFVGTMVQKNLALTKHQLTGLAKKGVEMAALVPRSVACSEADLHFKSVVAYKPKSGPALAYEELGRALIARLARGRSRRPVAV